MPCEILNCTERPQMHHDDYDQPLNVRWFCRKHHLELHIKKENDHGKEKQV